jgi:hypothetical protein
MFLIRWWTDYYNEQGQYRQHEAYLQKKSDALSLAHNVVSELVVVRDLQIGKNLSSFSRDTIGVAVLVAFEQSSPI